MTDAEVVPSPSWIRGWRARSVAAVLGATVSGLVAIAAFWVALGYVLVVAAFGVPAAAVAGFLFGPRAAATRRPWWAAAVLGLLAPPLGMLVVAAVSLLIGGGGTAAAWFLLYAAFAIPFAGPISVPVSMLTIFVGRRLVRHGLRVAGIVVLVAALATATLGAATRAEAERRSDLAAAGVPQEPHWIELIVAPVDLRWTVVNRSDRYLQLYVAEPTADGGGGSIHPLPPCSTTSGFVAIGDEWRLHVAADSADLPRALANPVVTSGQRPGPEPLVRIEIGADGQAKIADDSALPDGC